MVCTRFRICLEQIEKRRAEVNEEMAEIVNRFETATESLQPTFSDTHNDSSTRNNSLLEQSTTDNHMDQSEPEDDSYYQNNFKSAVNKRNDESSKHGNDHDDSSNDDDTNDESSSKIQKGTCYERRNANVKSQKSNRSKFNNKFGISFQCP